MIAGLGTATAAKAAVTRLGGAFMISPEAKAAGKAGGFRGWQLYVAGRGGVLGPAPAEVVVAALGFLEPRLVSVSWEAGLAVQPLERTVADYRAVCHAWGRRHYGELGDATADRLADLLQTVADAADTAGFPLFAGWRAQPLPDDGPARLAQLLHVVREHRGAAHIAAVRIAGLTPLEAVLAGSGGRDNARFFGWPEPFPEVSDEVRTRRDRAEQITDELVAPAYAVLGATESEVLLDGLATAAAVVRRAA